MSAIGYEDIPKIRERIANGQYKVSDTLVFHNDCSGRDISFKVIGVNAESRFLPPHITVMSEPSRNALPFDENDRNHWSTCSLRKYLNEEYPIEVPVLTELTHEVFKKNNDGQSDTLDRFWLLSLSELDDELSPYKEFVSDFHNLQGDCNRWLRSANRAYAIHTWFVNSTGAVSYGYYASTAFRFCPACVLW